VSFAGGCQGTDAPDEVTSIRGRTFFCIRTKRNRQTAAAFVACLKRNQVHGKARFDRHHDRHDGTDRVAGPGTNDHGWVDDVLMTDSDHKAGTAVISVGGLLGMGSKLVSVPFDQLLIENDRIVMLGATKASLEGMAEYRYTNV
jgi:hypothetical protein